MNNHHRSEKCAAALRKTRVSLALVAVLCVVQGGLGEGCTRHKVVFGEQCPAPDDSRATVQRGPDAGFAFIYGTSCAPCDAPPPVDERGCPTFVTFESCGGDICLGDLLIPRPSMTVPSDQDAGAVPADAAVPTDGGGAMEDAGGQS